MDENIYQTFPRTLYVISNLNDTETVIKDGKTGKQIGKMPAGSQGIIVALSSSIKTDNEISLNILK
ncbi:MAG: hypothetical protein MJ053_07345 [Elusimicrobiaceae bacterium]|nr:hypothetical protein [Elusimicrobiaceae bacterium]